EVAWAAACAAEPPIGPSNIKISVANSSASMGESVVRVPIIGAPRGQCFFSSLEDRSHYTLMLEALYSDASQDDRSVLHGSCGGISLAWLRDCSVLLQDILHEITISDVPASMWRIYHPACESLW